MRLLSSLPLLFAVAVAALPGGLVALRAAPASAQPANLGPEEQELARWREKVQEARDRVREARAELQAAEYAYQDWRQRKYPRGAERADVIGRLDAAKKELAAAEAALPEVVEEARRAGLPPGEFRELDVDESD